MASLMHIDWQALLIQYGYLTIFVGTFLEGESILILGGYAAHEGYLQLPQVLLAAFCGSFFGDQLYFVIGRWYGRQLLERWPRWKARIVRVDDLIRRYQTIFILGFRFLYGLRTITPFVLGAGSVHVIRFVILNALGAVLWTLSIGATGYLFGELITRWAGHIKQFEPYYFSLLIVGALGLSYVMHRRAKQKSEKRLTHPRSMES